MWKKHHQREKNNNYNIREFFLKKNIIGKKKLDFFIIIPRCWQGKVDKKVVHPKSN